MADDSELEYPSSEITINVDQSIVTKLKLTSEKAWGFVLGKHDGSNIYAASVVKVAEKGFDEEGRSRTVFEKPGCALKGVIEEILSSVPRGIDIVGVFYKKDLLRDDLVDFSVDVLAPYLNDNLHNFEHVSDNFLLCKANQGSGELGIDFLEKGDDSDGEKESPAILIKYSESVMNDLIANLTCLRLQCTLACQFSLSDVELSCAQELNRICSKIEDATVAFCHKSSKNLLFPNDSGHLYIEDFLNSSVEEDKDGPVNWEMLLDMTSSHNKDSNIYSPLLMFNATVDEIVKFSLNLDVILYCQKASKTQLLLQTAKDAFQIQAKHMLSTAVDLTKQNGFCKIGVLHFKPFSLKHFVTTVYPLSKLDGSHIPDEDLLRKRQVLHEIFILPNERPIFRKSQGFFNEIQSGYLVNPHKGLKSGLSNGTCATVYGRYAYHHYMQDRFDDNGWGCAYRSLQTVCSWFKLQGYTNANVPSHKVIQEALVNVGDKPKNFIGSRQWIGSFEVSICLEEIMQMQSKILHVSSGAEMAFKGRELIEHFNSQGTPIMIGGGVLAHTILGVHFNESTGDIKFLILDPHYTGGEDLKVVQDKGWCGWKGSQFWDQTAHYNMCLPQRPSKI